MKRPPSKFWKRLLVFTKPLQWLLLPRDPGVRLAAKTVFATDDYYLANPDLRDSGFTPALDYFRFGAAENRSPHPLFDTKFYLEKYPDVGTSSQNPLLHYLRFGAREGRDPHLLFQNNYYVERYADVREWGNPLLHFISIGQREFRQTSPFFDPDFYRATQVAACQTARGVLTQFVMFGMREGHPPSVEFDPAYYRLVHPDVANAGWEPFEHWVRYGKQEGRSIRTPRLESGEPRNYLPIGNHNALSSWPDKGIDIVVPVYRGLAETRACLESVFASTNQSATNLIVVNDATPELELAEYLRSLAAENRIHLIEHSTNAGFVAGVNEGMSVHPDRDVILLNSDTEVFGNWVDRLRRHAYSKRVATVTPFSNNATICSYPRFCQDNKLAAGASAAELDKAMLLANAGRNCAIPTAVGFCMYIRRDALQEVGLFDQAAFGQGYGEENDFCMRALNCGWEHLLAADIFVYHAGAVSFGPAGESLQRGLQALLKKHPRYPDHVNWHIRMDPANAFRISATLYRMRRSGLPARLNVSHNMGGGTLEYVRKLEQQTFDKLNWLHLEPAQTGLLRLFCERPGFEFSLVVDALHENNLLLDILRYVSIERIHVQHIQGFPIDIRKWVEDWQLPYDVTLHDYYFVCRRVNLKDENGRYCGEGNCPCEDATSIASWRALNGEFLARSARVIAPSADTATRFRNYFPGLKMIAAWHEYRASEVKPPVLIGDEPLKVAVLGIMSKHKGFDHLRDCVRIARQDRAPLEFIHIGGFGNEMEGMPHEIVSTGWYKPHELPGLLKRHALHLIWFPCQWPETFSYTLSVCLEMGLPVAAPDLGAFAERLSGRGWSWILPWNTNPQQWNDFFVFVRKEHFAKQLGPQTPQTDCEVEPHFYPAAYLQDA